VEADLISKAIGRPVAIPKATVRPEVLEDEGAVRDAEARLQAGHLDSPCPFLADNICSIYEHRPIACRTLINLDDDDLQCRHVLGEPASVPYANATVIKGLALAAQPGCELADIRDFFPSPGTR
jgi:hypothetical protein